MEAVCEYDSCSCMLACDGLVERVRVCEGERRRR